MKTCVFLLFSVLTTLNSFSQSHKISGKVWDENSNHPVPNAVISLLNKTDSILYSFTRSAPSGEYVLKNVPEGQYILMISQPLYADIYNDLNVEKNLELARTNLISKATLLQEVIVKTGAPFRVKGDTTVYTADSFKVSANANVEELLKKLPGIQVDNDGNIKAMGETVQKVLVDGEEFFGEDPGMAVKNLRADAVKEVQVFDKKSDQAEFTGIDDGNTKKTINLKLKEDKKKGYFGKIDVAAGPQKDIDPRYNTNLLYGSFKGKRKLAAFLLNGNTGQDGLSWEDEQKYGSSDYSMEMMDDGGITFYGGSSDGEPYINTENGFLTNLNAGLSYSNKWNDQYNLNLSPKYNEQHYDNHEKTFSQSQINKDSVLNRNSDEFSHVSRDNFKVRGVLDVKIDSFNSLKATVNTNFYHTENNQSNSSKTTGGFGTLKNTSERDLKTDYDKSAITGTLAFNHKFKKARRTVSFTGNWYSLDNKGKTLLKSINTAYVDGEFSSVQDLDQKKDNTLSTKNISGQIVYTEPLSKTLAVQLGYRLALNKGTNDQSTFNYDDDIKKYSELVDSLSNNFKQTITQQIPSITFNYSDKKLKMNIGSGFGFTHFDLEDITFSKNYIRDYTNFNPKANITYTYKPNHSIRFNYSGYTNQPSVDQLQPLRNNTDYFNQRIGNPDLKPSFTNNFRLFHQNYNFLKDIWSYQSIYFNTQQDAIINSSTVDLDSGKTVSQAVNVNGNYFLSFYSGFAFKIKKIDTRLDFGPGLSMNRYANIINQVKSFSKTVAPSMSISLNKSKEKKYDISVRNEFSYNSNTSTQTNNKIDYYTNTLGFTGTVYYKKVWSLFTRYNYYFRQKSVQADKDLKTHIWNAKLQRTFKNDEFTAYIIVRDILNQNVGIDRNFYGNTYTEQINDRLKRYFLLGFTWNFKNKASK